MAGACLGLVLMERSSLYLKFMRALPGVGLPAHTENLKICGSLKLRQVSATFQQVVQEHQLESLVHVTSVQFQWLLLTNSSRSRVSSG